MTKRIVLLGPPGSGKGTQATGLAEALGVPAISTGAIFRDHMARGTELGRQARQFITAGHLVPDELTDALVAARLAEADAAAGFVLDGYPRNPEQVVALDRILSEQGQVLDGALEITLDENLIVERLLRRAEIEGREDDSEPVIRERIAVYHAETAPVSTVYAERGVLNSVSGLGQIDEVAARLQAAVPGQNAAN
jgi:adenylate kinase